MCFNNILYLIFVLLFSIITFSDTRVITLLLLARLDSTQEDLTSQSSHEALVFLTYIRCFDSTREDLTSKSSHEALAFPTYIRCLDSIGEDLTSQSSHEALALPTHTTVIPCQIKKFQEIKKFMSQNLHKF